MQRWCWRKPVAGIVLTSLLGATIAVSAADESPKETPKEPPAENSRREQYLQQVLKRNPEADANHDGKLTAEEARAFLQKTRGGAAAPSTRPSDGVAANPAGAARAVRKTGRSNLPKPDFADVHYGSHPNNIFDLWLAKSDKPTPIVVFIHGGGFVGGDKSSASAAVMKQCLESGVSFASINYRFRTEASINVVLRDSARAIQFIRYKAADYNLDKTRLAVTGGSAGAGTSLWLAFHDDLADLKAEDPVLRESTRVSAAAANACQATYDILKWRDILGSDEAMRFYPQDTWPAFYGLKTLDELQSDKGKALRADADMLGMISKDDPPVWLASGDNHDALANKGDTNHTPKHAEAVKKRCDEIGVKATLRIGGISRDDSGPGSQTDFLLAALKAEKPR